MGYRPTLVVRIHCVFFFFLLYITATLIIDIVISLEKGGVDTGHPLAALVRMPIKSFLNNPMIYIYLHTVHVPFCVCGCKHDM